MSDDYLVLKIATRDHGTVDVDIRKIVANDPTISTSESITAECLVGNWFCLLEDTPLRSAGRRPYRTYRTFVDFLTKCGVRNGIGILAGLNDDLLHSLRSDDCGWVNGVKTDIISRLLATPISFEVARFLKTRDPVLLQYISSFLAFGKKTEFDMEQFRQSALRGWLDNEERLRDHLFGDLGQWALSSMRNLLECTFANVDWSTPTFMGKHGSGSVATKERSVTDKTLGLVLTPSLALLMDDDGPLMQACRDSGHPEWIAQLREWFRVPLEKELSQLTISKQSLVPQDRSKARCISMEPASYMFWQQHVRFLLERAITKTWIGANVRIDDQTYNQRLCIRAGKTGDSATIDLSRASDSVLMSLIEFIMPQPLLHLLSATRTDKVRDIKGVVHKVNKFAPMGSATCFPTQCVVFWAVCMTAYAEYCHVDFTSYSSLDDIVEGVLHIYSLIDQELLAPIGIYGDDIIVDNCVYEMVVAILDDLGFVVNAGKSFSHHQWIRESCGIFTFQGEDFTPIVFKQKTIGRGFDARSATSLIDFINRVGDVGWLRVRSWALNFLLKYNPPRGMTLNPVFFSNDRESFGIFTKNPRNDHLKRSVCDEGGPGRLGLFLDSVRAWVLVPLERDDHPHRKGLEKPKRVEPGTREYIRVQAFDWYSDLLHWRRVFHAPELGEFRERWDTRGSRLGLGWTPVRY